MNAEKLMRFGLFNFFSYNIFEILDRKNYANLDMGVDMWICAC